MAAVKAAMKVISKVGLKEPWLVCSMVERMVATMAQLKGIPMAAKRVAVLAATTAGDLALSTAETLVVQKAG